MREPVPQALVGERLDRIVSMMTGCSRAEATDLEGSGQVRVNGKVVTSRTHRLALGDEVDAPEWVPAGAPEIEPDTDVPLTVVFEDEDIVVVNKDPGIVVHPGTGNPSGTLVHALVARYPELRTVGDPERPGIVHRLDADTSGLLVVARTERAYESLVAQLSDHSVNRQYDALVWGAFDTDSGRVDAAVGRSRRHPTRMAVTADGRHAVTDYTVVSTWTQPVVVSRLRCRLHTGRTHQIRVHLQSIGHAVVGDPLYGGVRESLASPRLWLHAAELGFAHPVTGDPMVFTAELPADLAEVLTGLR